MQRLDKEKDCNYLYEGGLRIELTKHQRDHYLNLFDLIDRDSSGAIHVSELASFMQSFGHRISQEHLTEMFNDTGADINHDSELSLDEYLEFIRASLVVELPKAMEPLLAVRCVHCIHH